MRFLVCLSIHLSIYLPTMSIWQAGNENVLRDARMLTGEENYTPTDARDLANKLLYTCYMGTKNSSAETRHRAKTLASEIGAYHSEK
jgi:NAD+ synthase (glutamine-hydrolysing)